MEEMQVERAYKTMSCAGAGNIVIGIIMIVTGITAGIISILSGANLLRRKSELTF